MPIEKNIRWPDPARDLREARAEIERLRKALQSIADNEHDRRDREGMRAFARWVLGGGT